MSSDRTTETPAPNERHPLAATVLRLIREGMPGIELVDAWTLALLLGAGRHPSQRVRAWHKFASDLLADLEREGELVRVDCSGVDFYRPADSTQPAAQPAPGLERIERTALPRSRVPVAVFVRRAPTNESEGDTY